MVLDGGDDEVGLAVRALAGKTDERNTGTRLPPTMDEGLDALARLRVALLAELGEVREIGSGPNDPQRRYFRVDG